MSIKTYADETGLTIKFSTENRAVFYLAGSGSAVALIPVTRIKPILEYARAAIGVSREITVYSDPLDLVTGPHVDVITIHKNDVPTLIEALEKLEADL